MSRHPYELSLADASKLIASRELSPLELTDSVLLRIEQTEPVVSAWAVIDPEHAREQARSAEAEIAAGQYRGPLHGIPLGVKDLYDVAGFSTRNGSAASDPNPVESTGPMMRRLVDAGMIVLGKTNTHEYALGGITPSSRNPWNEQHIPGGSSGGSGAALASGQCLVATGTDTAGSIRIPAAACGLVGLKPTAGLVSRAGITPLSTSLDTAGALTRTVLDGALVLREIAGYDPSDPGSVKVPADDYVESMRGDIRGLRVGVVSPDFMSPCSPDVLAAFAQATEALRSEGAHVKTVEVPFADLMLPIHRSIVLSEAGAFHKERLLEHGELFTDEVRRVLEAAQFIFATDYVRAQELRVRAQEAWKELFEEIDVLASPTLASAAPVAEEEFVDWGQHLEKEHTRMVMIRLTLAANVTGLPSLALPMGMSQEQLPLSLQITGRPFEESTLLRAGFAFESATGLVGRIASIG